MLLININMIKKNKIKIFLISLIVVIIFFALYLLIGNREINGNKLTYDELEVQAEEAKTADDLARLLNENGFKYVKKEGSDAINSDALLKEKRGGKQDFAKFVASELMKKGFISFVFVYEYEKDEETGTEYLVSFRDLDLPKYIYFNNSGTNIDNYGWSFEDICLKEEERLKVKIIKYGTVSPLENNLIPKEWINYKEDE